jgi:predicted ATPase
VDDKVTVLVGKNESGKTAALEATANTHYFQENEKFKFSVTHDYPRNEKKKYDKSGEVAEVVTCHYRISTELMTEIAKEIGEKSLLADLFTITSNYSNKETIGGIRVNAQAFLEHFIKVKQVGEPDETKAIRAITSLEDIQQCKTKLTQDHAAQQEQENTSATKAERPPVVIAQPTLLGVLDLLTPYFSPKSDSWEPLNYFVYIRFIKPSVPKFLYYDEYYALPSRIDVQKLQARTLDSEDQQTASALFELADININELISAPSFENYIAELEATGNHITRELFNYWRTNAELRVRFQMDRVQEVEGVHHVLDIRVENLKHGMSLPLGNRSKGFNWFFSFIVWFSKIQEDKNSNYVLLLDEPGLNLHASAQADLLRYIEDLSENYQVIYSTHSPFMVDSNSLHRVRTIFDGPQGSVISESIQERDPDTLFPLQAALGYDIAQNLFVSKNNLLVEGAADLIYLTVVSAELQAAGRDGLDDGITIVPVGGLDKVVSFISLLRGSKLNIVCLLDSFTDQKGKQRVDDLVREKIIKEKNIRFFDEFAAVGKLADIEDLFDTDEYLKLFNGVFEKDHGKIAATQLKANERILPQINRIISKDRFNHYRPAHFLASQQDKKFKLSDATLGRFEKMFAAINGLFRKAKSASADE